VFGRLSSKQRQFTMAVFVPPPRRYMCENVEEYPQATCIYLSFIYMSVRDFLSRALDVHVRASRHLISLPMNMVNP
jgi:hypothetical protein